MKSDERLFTGFGLHVFEDLLFVVDQKVALLMGWLRHGWHGHPLVVVSGVAAAGGSPRCNQCAN